MARGPRKLIRWGLAALAVGTVGFVFAPSPDRVGYLATLGLQGIVGRERFNRWERASQNAAEYRRWTSERRASELAEEARLKAIPVSDCANFSSATGPRICLQIVGAPSRPFGSPVDLKLRWAALPSGSGIHIGVQSSAPAGERFRYAGPVGTISGGTFGRTAVGEALVRWDGKSTRCAPADAPMMCDVGEVGRFAISATLYTGDDPGQVGWLPQNRVPTRTLLKSPPVLVNFTGLPRRWQPGWNSLGSTTAGDSPLEALARATPEGALGNSGPEYWRAQVERISPWQQTWFSYCADLDLLPPLTGKLSICFPRSRRDEHGIALKPGDFTVSGVARTVPSFMPAARAEAIAERHALTLVRGKYDFSHYPSDSDLKVFAPDDSPDASALRSRVRWVSQNQTISQLSGVGASFYWIVSVDQYVQTLDQQPVTDFYTYF
jgi:hypothetical protein